MTAVVNVTEKARPIEEEIRSEMNFENISGNSPALIGQSNLDIVRRRQSRDCPVTRISP
jgi:hypothetical protein